MASGEIIFGGGHAAAEIETDVEDQKQIAGDDDDV
jgi:hypothetical protein